MQSVIKGYDNKQTDKKKDNTIVVCAHELCVYVSDCV